MKSFIITAIFLLAIAWLGYQGFQTFAQSPNELTQQTASSIIKYPNSQDWQIKNHRNVCFFTTEECNQPVVITFHSSDAWNQIYFFYKIYQASNNWSTKNIIVTSIPTSIVFTNKNGCTATLKQHKPFLNLDNNNQKNTYKFSITCPEVQK